MNKVVLEISISLDGCIAGPSIDIDNPLGHNGELLHHWMFRADAREKELVHTLTYRYGAVLVGARTYTGAIDIAWNKTNPFNPPPFVVINPIPAETIAGFNYIDTGIHDALLAAKNSAGEKDILVMGGAGLAQKYLQSNLIDEIILHTAPVFLGNGTRLFHQLSLPPGSFQLVSSEATTHATHTILKRTTHT